MANNNPQPSTQCGNGSKYLAEALLVPPKQGACKASHFSQWHQFPAPEPEVDKLLEHYNLLLATAGDDL